MANVKKPATKKRRAQPVKAKPKNRSLQPTSAKQPTAAVAAAADPRQLPGVWSHLKTVLRFWRQHWRFIAGFLALYILLSVVFVHNFAGGVADLKNQLATILDGNQALTGLGTYALVVTTTSSATGASAVYQYVLLVLFSLAFIWAMRQFLCDKTTPRVTMRRSFYDSMYPLVPFVLVLVVLSLTLLPLALGGSLVGTVLANGIAASLVEQILWVVALLVCAALTIWLLTIFLFAVYIVTLPGGRPLQALRDSRRLTAGKRLNIVRKLVFLIVGALIIGAVMLVPVILLVAPLTSVILFVLSALALPFIHSYLYLLYRELLA